MTTKAFTTKLEEIRTRMDEEPERGRLFLEQLEAEGLPAELPPEENVESLGEREPAAFSTIQEDFADEISAAFVAEDACPDVPVLTAEDETVLSLVRENGHAATVLEAGNPSDEQVCRLADSGVAYLHADGKETVLAMAGATDGDVRRAGARARAEKVARRFEEDLRTCERIAQETIARAQKLTVVDRNELANRFAPAIPREATDAVIRELGPYASEDPRATDPEIDEAIERAAEIERQRGRNLSRKDKTFAAGISGSEGEYDARPTMLEYARGRAALMGADAAHAALAERLRTFQEEARNLKYAGRCALLKRDFPFRITLSEAFGFDAELAEWTRSRTGKSPFSKASPRGLEKAAARRAENARAVRGAAQGPKATRLESWKPGEKFRRRSEREQARRFRPLSRRDARKAAWNTARAVFFSGLDLKHRVLYAVSREELVSLEDLKDRFGALDAGLRRALRVLVRAEKVKPVRRKSDGEVFVEALVPFDAEAHRTLFLAEIEDPANGIPSEPVAA